LRLSGRKLIGKTKASLYGVVDEFSALADSVGCDCIIVGKRHFLSVSNAT